MKNSTSAFVALLLPALLGGCDFLYASRQGAERQECLRKPNTEEFRECANRPVVTYNDYTKQRESLSSAKPVESTAPNAKPGPVCFTNATTGQRVCTD